MKLTDTELVMLSRAAQRDDRAIDLPITLKLPAAEKIVGKLLKGGLFDEVRASGSLPVWRRSEGEGAFALLVTRQRSSGATSCSGLSPTECERSDGFQSMSGRRA
jgi:hypothetical protein